jgi:hypothetical protein
MVVAELPLAVVAAARQKHDALFVAIHGRGEDEIHV